MRNKYVNGMQEIKAEDALKRSILENMDKEAATRPGSFFPLKKAAALATVFLLVLTAMFGAPLIRNGDNTDTNGPQGVQRLFEGFIVTAYAEDGTPVEVKPEVIFLLGRYTLLMSSAPGLPLKLDCKNADKLVVTATDGQFLLWTPQIIPQGKDMELKPGDTLYWTPMILEQESGSVAESASITVRAFKGKTEIGSAQIQITSDEHGMYSGKLVP